MGFKERMVRRFERRLREADDALGAWAWTAIVIAALSLLTIFVGIMLALDHFDNIGTSFVGLGLGIVLLTLLSPGWAARAALRRHRRRLSARRSVFGARRDLVDQMFALGRIPESAHRAQRGRLDRYLAGTGPGDAARVASSWFRLVGTMVLLTALLAIGAGVFATLSRDEELAAIAVPITSLVAAVSGGLAVAMLVAAAGLGRSANVDVDEHVAAIDQGHDEILALARSA